MTADIGRYAPLPPSPYNPAFMEKHGIMLLRESDSELTIGIVERGVRTEALLERFHGGSGKQILFKEIERKDHSAWLARIVSDGTLGYDRASGAESALSLDKLSGDAPVINLVNSIFMDGIRRNASDIHIEKFGNRIQVRYRIDGVLHVARILNGSLFSFISSRIKIMAQMNIMEKRLPQDGRISVSLGDDKVDLRVSILPVSGEGESIVLRLLNRTAKPLPLDELGFSDSHIGDISRLLKLSNGLVLVTGPTGSGKSTTLNSMLRRIHSDEIKIISIEDPVEYIVEGVEQIQTNEEIGLTFSSLLRRVLRQDPNVIMVGEIRDRETAELAVRSALTGHLVLSTLHTNDALAAVTRLLNMGIEPFLLSSVLRGITAQRLVRTICPRCREYRKPTGSEAAFFLERGYGEPESLATGRGCDFCEHSGYRGRTLINELVCLDEEWEDVLGRGGARADLRALFSKRGIGALLDDGLDKIAKGMTTLMEVEKAVNS